MMKIKLSLLALALCLAGCVGPAPDGYPALPDNRDYTASYDRVWAAVFAVASRNGPLQSAHKAQGEIVTQPFKLAHGELTENVLKRYAYPPPTALATWSDGRAVVTFDLMPHDGVTNVRARAKISGFENNIAQSWIDWPTRGTLEQLALTRIAQALAAPAKR
ncbi:MAG TPA: hypothetical protein VGG02_13630 [Chthoniobacterales bacterium]|jgi:hypothetical protein